MKKCSKCKLELDISLFNKDKLKKDGLANRCKQCTKEYYKTHRYRYKQQINSRRYSIIQKLQDYKTTLSCKLCGKQGIKCLDFHHKDNNKIDSIANMASLGYSWAKILEEIKKCDVLCANCHREVH